MVQGEAVLQLPTARARPAAAAAAMAGSRRLLLPQPGPQQLLLLLLPPLGRWAVAAAHQRAEGAARQAAAGAGRRTDRTLRWGLHSLHWDHHSSHHNRLHLDPHSPHPKEGARHPRSGRATGVGRRTEAAPARAREHLRRHEQTGCQCPYSATQSMLVQTLHTKHPVTRQ
jgi:hypothetical protein